MEPNTAPYPAQVELNRDYEVARWRPLVNWLLAIPQLIVVYLLGIVFQIVTIIAFFTVLFTKKIPTGIFGVLALYLRLPAVQPPLMRPSPHPLIVRVVDQSRT